MTVKRSIMNDLMDQAALDSTFSRGTMLYYSGAAHIAQIERDDDGFADISGTVTGSAGKYNVLVTVDERQQFVIGHECGCPAHDSYAGMCKHTIALALEYVESLQRGKASAKTRTKPVKGAKSAGEKIRTSQAISRLLAGYANRAQEEVRLAGGTHQAALVEEPVDLQCVISSGESAYRYSWSSSGTWSLGLKVVRGKTSYVVKHIDELVEAWHRGETVKYGKNLEFTHRPAAFTERANSLLSLLTEILDAQQSLYVAQESKYYRYASDDRLSTKTLPLSSSQMGQVLDLMVGQKVVVERFEYDRYRYNGTREKSTMAVLDGNPNLEVEVKPEGDGYGLSVYPDDFECIAGGERVYLMGADAVYRCTPEFSDKLGLFCEELFPGNETLRIAAADMPGFCASLLDALREFTKLKEPDGLDALRPPQAEFRFRIALANGYVTCMASVLYGDEELSLFEPVRPKQPTRHVVREMAAQQAVLRYFPEGDVVLPDYSQVAAIHGHVYGGMGNAWRAEAPAAGMPSAPCFPETDDEAYYLLFAEGLRELSGLGEVLLSDRLARVQVRQPPEVKVEASVAGGLLDIAVESLDMTPAELISYLASYQRKQKYVRLDNGDIIRLGGSVGAVADLAAGLGLDASELVDGVEGLPQNRTLFVDAMLKRASGVRFERDDGFRSIVRDFETVADADFIAPDGLREILRPYQAEGFKWLCTLGKCGFGGILADDMGLGKTLQMMAYMAYMRAQGERRPALVVCPASLVYNWQAEFGRFCPSMRAVVVAGGKQTRLAQVAAAAESDVLITSYDLMKRDVEVYSQQSFHCAVLDEAQYIKNASTKAAKAAKQLVADVRFALTGTPIENRLSELWSIFDYLMPGVLGTAEEFNRRFANPIGDGDDAAAQRLRNLVSPFILRRLKGDVLRDLPDKNESVVVANMEGEQAKLYKASASKLALMLSDQKPEEFAGMKLKVLAELTKLRQICCDPSLLYDNFAGTSAKLETCMEMVRTAVEGGHQVLLFSQFTSMLSIIADRLQVEGVHHLLLTGATSKEERMRLVKRFQDGEAPVFLISLKAGGVGLNLTAADIVIHYDPWWNLAAQDQATDRAHRIGQEREVSVFKLIAKDTIEEKIVQMQEAKRDLADKVIGGEGVGRTGITREDILALLEAGR